MRMAVTKVQQQHRPKHLPRPPLVNEPLWASFLHILRPAFFGICRANQRDNHQLLNLHVRGCKDRHTSPEAAI